MKSLALGLVLVGTMGLTGCGTFGWSGHHVHDDASPHGHHNWADEPYFASPGLKDEYPSSEGKSVPYLFREGYFFSFRTLPEKPKWDDKTILALSIVDVSKSTPTVVTGAQMTCKTVMFPGRPSMLGVIHNYKTHDAHYEPDPGVYTMPILFGVGGKWEIRYHIRLPNDKEFRVSFPLEVQGSGDPVQEWENMQPEVPKFEDLRDIPKLPKEILPMGK